MPQYFTKKGFNKRTWQFRKNHPVVHTHVWEAKARIEFFDQIEELTRKDLPKLNIVEEPEGTPPIATKEPIVKTSKRTAKVYLMTASKVGQKCLNRPTLQTIMSKYQQDLHTTELQNPEDQQVMSVPEYLAAVRHDKIPKGPNHEQIEKLTKLPGDHSGTKVIVLTYSQMVSRVSKDRKPPKST